MMWGSATQVRVLAVVVLGTLTLGLLRGVSLAYRRYLGLGVGSAQAVVLAVFPSAVCLGIFRAYDLGRTQDPLRPWAVLAQPELVFEHRPELAASVVVAAASAFFAAALAGRVGFLWWEPSAAAPSTPLRAGLRAWVSPGDVVCVAAVALGAWLGFGFSFWGTLLLAAGALLSRPLLLHMEAIEPGAGAHPPKSERDRVLRLLEEGRITPDECGELLAAIGPSVPSFAGARTGRLSFGQKLGIAGAVLVVAGFLFPWLTVDLRSWYANAENAVQHHVSSELLPVPAFSVLTTVPGEKLTLSSERGSPTQAVGNLRIVYRGGDMPHGLGWVILLLALAAAVLPLVELPAGQRSWLSAGALLGGSLLTVYLITDSWAWVSIGIFITVLGFAVHWYGWLIQRRYPTASEL